MVEKNVQVCADITYDTKAIKLPTILKAIQDLEKKLPITISDVEKTSEG